MLKGLFPKSVLTLRTDQTSEVQERSKAQQPIVRFPLAPRPQQPLNRL